MSLLKSASASASASGPRSFHLRSGASSHRLHAVRVALCSAIGSPKSAAHAHPSQSVHVAPTRRWAASREILAEAARIDAEEDELYGDARGDELPEHLRTAEGRKAALREAKRQLDAERAERLEQGGDTDAGAAESEGSEFARQRRESNRC